MSPLGLSRRGVLAAAGGALLGGAVRAAETADVIVIGAGLSGLHATSLLEAQGVRVLLLEGRTRVGGRVHTLDDVPGKPEAGGNGIGPSYARVLDWVGRTGLKLQPMRVRSDPGFLETVIHYRGRLIHERDWAASPLNPFPQAYRAKKPWEIQVPFFLTGNPLPDIEAWREPKYGVYDISLFDAIKAKGLDDASIDLGFDKAGLYGTSAFDVSMLGMYQIFALANYVRTQFSGEISAIVGGNQRLPEAVAAALKTERRLGVSVVAIRAEGGTVTVHARDGRVFGAKRVIVTAPFPALRQVLFDPVLPAIQAEAVAELGYSVGHQIHFTVKRRFWESDGLPITMWTDGPIGRLAPLYYGANQKDPTTIIAFVNGARAVALDRMRETDAIAFVLDVLAAIRPSTKGALTAVKVQSWQRDPFAGGIYSSWKPGQIVRYANTMARPVGPIHFAGEHTAQLNRGMEGAMESGERAALEVLGSL